MRTSLQHNERLNLIGALCLTPRKRKITLRLHSSRKAVSGEQVLRFLAHLFSHIAGPLMIVWDKHPIHRRRSVQEFLGRHPRVQVYEFPTSTPELNPTEFVWTQVNEYTASTAPHNGAELRNNVFAGIARTRRSPRRLWACIFASDLPWVR